MAKKIEKKKENTEKDKELTETLQRLQADFENYKKRVDKEKLQFIDYANKEMVIDLLPILDNFELILKNSKDEAVKMLYAELFSLLEKKGLKKIKAEKFDPYLHEALISEKSDKAEGTILEELQSGYMLNDQVVRHTKVKISK